jgi:hypothetical protein
MELNYEEDTKIDMYSIDVSLLNQSELRVKWLKVLAQAKKEKAHAKARVGIVHSDLADKARKRWEILGFTKKPTDQMVKDWIPLRGEYQEAEAEYIDACHDVDILSGVKDTFDDRRASLSELVKLYLHGYFADESMIGKEARDLLVEIRKGREIDQLNVTDQRKKLNQRRKK